MTQPIATFSISTFDYDIGILRNMHNTTVNALWSDGLFTQKENAEVTYTINWAPYLDTDTILSSTWVSETSGSTIANEANTTIEVSARLSGTPGRYLFTNKVVLASGDTREKQIDLLITKNDQSNVRNYHA